MRMATAVAALFAASLISSPARAQVKRRFDIPAQRLDAALFALGAQAQISIGGADPRIMNARSHAMHGVTTVARALSILLRGTDFDFVIIDASAVRIVRATRKKPLPPPPPPKPKLARTPAPIKPTPNAPPPVEPPSPPVEIIVTASKQQQGLNIYPGTAHVEIVGSFGLPENAGSAALVARLPTLSSTNLGPGRNKIFVRGIADSSFSGPTQSTSGLYLGDLRLTYNAPEPDLRLYDIERVEVVEGPQGTLYGAGTLGGIIRIVPAAPDLTAAHAIASGGVSVTQGGKAGYDLGGTINLPLAPDRLGLRFTGYRQREGGTTENLGTGARNSDDVRIQGARATLRLAAGSRWTVDLGGVIQFLETRDAHYAERGLPRHTRRAAIAQPHENDFRGASLTVTKEGDAQSIVSVTGAVLHDLTSVYDATGYQARLGLLAYREDNHIRLITHETRFAHKGESGATWVLGVSALHSNDRVDRTLGQPGAPFALASLRNGKDEVALFGEATQPITPHWSMTLGARLANTRTVGELFDGSDTGFEPKRNEWRLLPTAALSWKLSSDVIAFVRYQTGARSGGIAISADQINSARRFSSDTISTIELGTRFGSNAASRLSGGVTAFHSSWKDVQADLISVSGLPYTDNIGRGSISGVEVNLAWRPTPALMLSGAMFVNDSALRSTTAGATSLPNIPKLGSHADVSWSAPLSQHTKLNLSGSLRYVGVSSLGTAAPLILEQGETVQADAQMTIDFGALKASLDISNVFDAGGNSFAYGNPFSAGDGQQITPLRPRTIRLGLGVRF
jgi:iron complex outermembrane recepter protein